MEVMFWMLFALGMLLLAGLLAMNSRVEKLERYIREQQAKECK